MNEGKKADSGSQPFKKSASGQKSPAKKPEREQPASEPQTRAVVDMGSTLPLVKKIDEVCEEIGSKPLRSFEKKEQAKLLQSYEKLISRIVREINNSRR